MKPELQDWFLETLRQSKELAINQAPEVVRQYIQAESIDCIVCIVVSLMIFSVCSGFFFWLYKKYKNENGYDECLETIKIVGPILGGMGIIISSILFFTSLSTYLQIKIAPMGYLLEHFLGHR